MKEVKKPTSRRNLDRFCSLVTLLRSLAYAIATPRAALSSSYSLWLQIKRRLRNDVRAALDFTGCC